MSIYNDLCRYETLESIIVALHDQIFNLAVHGALSRVLTRIRIEKIVVSVDHAHRCFSIFRKDHLIVVAVDGNARNVMLFFHIQ